MIQCTSIEDELLFIIWLQYEFYENKSMAVGTFSERLESNKDKYIRNNLSRVGDEPKGVAIVGSKYFSWLKKLLVLIAFKSFCKGSQIWTFLWSFWTFLRVG